MQTTKSRTSCTGKLSTKNDSGIETTLSVGISLAKARLKLTVFYPRVDKVLREILYGSKIHRSDSVLRHLTNTATSLRYLADILSKIH
jgi:hypothetical protein